MTIDTVVTTRTFSKFLNDFQCNLSFNTRVEYCIKVMNDILFNISIVYVRGIVNE